MAVRESSIGAMLRASREDLQKTQKEVAEYVGVSEGTISRWESGYTDSMRRDKIARLSKVLNISPLDILGIEDQTGFLPQVSSRVTIDNTSPFYTIYQAYICRPDAVQKEMVKRFGSMDATFSRKVSKLLLKSGHIDKFMEGTGLSFSSVGKLMQGETIQTTPDEAEKIAAYFHADVVDLFFDAGKPVHIEPTLTHHGYYLEPIVNDYLKEYKAKKKDRDICHKLLCDEKVNTLIDETLKLIKEDRALDEFDEDDAYHAIAMNMANEPEKFLDDVTLGPRPLYHDVRTKFGF